MYSLYRAWLSMGPFQSALPPPQSSSPLNLSTPSQISGAPDINLQVGPNLTQFSAHRSVLSTHSGFFKAALINHPAHSAVVVPNVNVDEFSSLLTFMYTGYLDLNIANIYNILLATHILHMPRALEICRGFLLHNQSFESHPNIIKPIPSRKILQPTQEIYTPTTSNFKKSEATPFKTISSYCDKIENRASTSKIENPIKSQTIRELTIDKKLDKTRSVANNIKKRPASSSNETNDNNNKVIIDIACCDGPVRFHRVINKNYGMNNNYQNNEGGNYETRINLNRNAALNKVMNENIRDQKLCDEENQDQNSELFTCLYCNHTFKSQYCYQKHARRHLNPVSIDAKAKQETAVKREVKLLDMNVQYYPCKSCGSKFPSYYFVHKHRKLCHAEEMADNANKNNEMLPENNSQSGNVAGDISNDSNSSAIDVEAINNN